MSSTEISPIEFGKLIEAVSEIRQEVHAIKHDVDRLNGLVSKGWGIFIGVAAVLGFFVNELIAGVKRILGIS